MVVHSEHPLNAEPSPQSLISHGIVPTDDLFNRNHGEFRPLDKYILQVEGLVNRPLRLSVDDLAKMEKVEKVVYLQCAGNRRREMSERTHHETEGIQWQNAAISNSEYGGVLLSRILELCSPLPEATDVEFVSSFFPIAEADFYSASIPLSKVEENEVLLAYEQNGEPLTVPHGYPLRSVVPAVSGCRSVKWLDKIVFKNCESQNFYQQKDYKVLPPNIETHEQADKVWEQYSPMYDFSVQCAIVEPEDGGVISGNSVLVKGYATGDAKGPVENVYVSCGQGWIPAVITYRQGKWSWTLWECCIDVSSLRKRSIKISARAETSHSVQEKSTDWNLRGVGESSWPSIAVRIGE